MSTRYTVRNTVIFEIQIQSSHNWGTIMPGFSCLGFSAKETIKIYREKKILFLPQCSLQGQDNLDVVI